MSWDLKPIPPTTRCTECGEDGLTLAIDKTHYHELTFKNGEWSVSPLRHTEMCEAEYSVRLFCPHCGAYFHVPETINGAET